MAIVIGGEKMTPKQAAGKAVSKTLGLARYWEDRFGQGELDALTGTEIAAINDQVNKYVARIRKRVLGVTP